MLDVFNVTAYHIPYQVAQGLRSVSSLKPLALPVMASQMCSSELCFSAACAANLCQTTDAETIIFWQHPHISKRT